MTTIETDRLLLRPLREDDLDDYSAFVAVTVEPGHSSYSYVSQYKVAIDAPRNVVGEFLE